ncbi:hypothetical protein [Sulfitobacter geojensis]|uniref:hypothetical protein n=1 Tax=Sulfitobacter geojensis TaxID=1342299 RepID=UPI000468FCAD|nr:hypothetical protein [Sulfitobacter geojensis]NYI29063.1 hypothetical protein [Sulfitobacter geojensis]
MSYDPQFPKRKLTGDETEYLFMEKIAEEFGGAAQSTISLEEGNAPKFAHPSIIDDAGPRYSVSPDFVFYLPHYPKGFTTQAQVKRKKVYGPSDEPFIYLDEKELHRLNRAADYFDLLFVIHLPDAANTDGSVAEWLWVDAEDLKATRLHQRTVARKKTFLIPLTLFKPFTALSERIPYVPANTNTPPAYERPRTQTH